MQACSTVAVSSSLTSRKVKQSSREWKPSNYGAAIVGVTYSIHNPLCFYAHNVIFESTLATVFKRVTLRPLSSFYPLNITAHFSSDQLCIFSQIHLFKRHVYHNTNAKFAAFVRTRNPFNEHKFDKH